jgi:predicted XRE-type DNA-binding protein
MQDVNSILLRLQGAGLSQAEISRRTAIPQPRLSKWLAGNCPKSVNDALILAKLAQEVAPEAEPSSEAHP